MQYLCLACCGVQVYSLKVKKVGELAGEQKERSVGEICCALTES